MMKVKLSEKTCRKPLRGNWVLVNYCNVKFPGEIVNIVANEFKVNVMHKSGNTF